jgi:hypothetical protein
LVLIYFQNLFSTAVDSWDLSVVMNAAFNRLEFSSWLIASAFPYRGCFILPEDIAFITGAFEELLQAHHIGA